jgi:hypothetical protein
MTTQYTTILKLALPVQGELSGTWGDVVNNNITQMVEQAVAGKAVINTWTANSHTLTTADGTTSESRCAILELTDSGTALTGAGTVVCPTNTKLYIVDNNTAEIITVQTAAGTGVAVPVGKTMLVYCDGTNVVEGVTHANSLSLGTSTVTADKILDEDNMASDSATAIATQQSIKAYVDSQVGTVDTLSEILANGNTTGANDIDVDSAQKVQFRDADIYLNSSVDGQLDIVADTEIQIAATTVDLNGNLDVSGTALVAGVLTTTAATVFNGGFASNADSTLGTDKKVQFRDAAIYLNSSVDGQLDIVADGEVQIDTALVDINGNLDVSGTTNISGSVSFTKNAIAGVAISTTSRASNTVTVTTSAVHGLTSGDLVNVNGVADTSFNGYFTVSVSSTTVFTYSQTGADGSSTGGTSTEVVYNLNASGTALNWMNGPLNIAANSGIDGLEITQSGAGNGLHVTGTTGLVGNTTLTGNLDVSGTALVTGVLTTTAATVFNGGFASNADSTLGTDKKVQFRDSAIYINSSVDGQLDIVADTEIQIAATTVDLNGNLDVSGTALVTGVLTTTAATVFNGGFASNADSTLGTDKKVQFRDSAIYINSSADGQLDLVADTEIQIAATTIDVNGTLAFDSLKGTGATTVTNILDEDNMASDSATAIATQQSIKAYVDSQVGSFDTLAEVLAQGNTTGGTDLAVSTGDDITFADSSKAIFGAGSDLQIYHDASDSIINDNGTGSLKLQQGGSTKLEVTTTGIDVTGSVTADSLTTDDDVAGLSTLGRYSSEFAYSLVRPSATATGIEIRTNAGNALAHFLNDGTTTLLNNGSAKLTTLSTGIDVTGTVTADGLVVSAPSGDTPASIVTTTGGSFLQFTDGNTTAGRSPLVGAITDDLLFYTNAGSYSEKLRISAAGNLLSGTGVAKGSRVQAAGAAASVSPTLGSATDTSLLLTNSDVTYGMNFGVINNGNGWIQQHSNTGTAAAYNLLLQPVGGNVGIGTDSPSRRLHVKDSDSFVATFEGGTNVYTSWSNSTGTAGYIGSANGLGSGGLTDFAVRSENNLIFLTNAGSERMRLDSAGTLLINSSTTADTGGIKLFSSSGVNALPATSATTQTGGALRLRGADNAVLDMGLNSVTTWIQATDKANLANSYTLALNPNGGNVGIGTSSPSTYAKFAIRGGITANAGVTSLTGVSFSTSDAANSTFWINHASAVTNLVSDAPMVFFGPSGSGVAERMRIDTSGNLLVGKSAASPTAVGWEARPTGATFTGYASTSNDDWTSAVYSTTGTAYRFYVGMAGTVFATSTVISAISDIRYKENVRDLDDGLDKIMALKPRKFDWKEGKGRDVKDDRGWIAQELEVIFPDMIDEWADPSPEGEEPYKAVRPDLIPVLVKAIQEQQATIEALTARIAALES